LKLEEYFVATIDTNHSIPDTLIVPDRQTMNVSLPPGQERFVREQVAMGRYRSASEVVRDGLRLLEEQEQRRLLEKLVVEGLPKEESARLGPELAERARAHFAVLINEARSAARDSGWSEPSPAIDRINERLRRRTKDAG
jgi:putative addiction module CopG family antidote